MDGRDLAGLHWRSASEPLKPLLAKLPSDSPIWFSSHAECDGPKFFAQACKLHLEGIVSDLASSPNRSGRSDGLRQ